MVPGERNLLGPVASALQLLRRPEERVQLRGLLSVGMGRAWDMPAFAWLANRSSRKGRDGPAVALRAMAGNLRVDRERRLASPTGFEPVFWP